MKINNTPKKIIRQKKVPLMSIKNVFSKGFPETTLTLSNISGEMVLSEMEIKVKTPAQYNSMPFFYSNVLPLLIPLQELTKQQEKELEAEKKRRRCYVD